MPENLPKIYMGTKQITGIHGESAYQVAVAHGYTGTEDDFAELVTENLDIKEVTGSIMDSYGTRYVAVMDKAPLPTLICEKKSTGIGRELHGYASDMVCDESFIYYAAAYSNKILKIDKNTLNIVAESVSFGDHTQTLLMDDQYLYYILYADKKVIKIAKSNLSKVAESATQVGSASCIRIDDSRLYYADKSANKVIVLNKATLALIGSTTAAANPSVDIVVDSSYIYYLNDNSSLSTIIKYDKSTFAKISESGKPSQGRLYGLFADDTYLYSFIYYSDKSALRRYLKTTLAPETDGTSLDSLINSGIVDGSYLYVSNMGEMIYKLLIPSGTLVAYCYADGGSTSRICTDDSYIYHCGFSAVISKIPKKEVKKYIIDGYIIKED